MKLFLGFPYSSPTVVEMGRADKLIKGDCNWGVENFALDKTGYTVKDMYYCDCHDCRYASTQCTNSNYTGCNIDPICDYNYNGC